MIDLLRALWQYRTFVVASITGELRGRFARSQLGALWFILNPLAQAAIFAIVLSEMIGARFAGSNDKLAFPVYLMAGMAAWGLFSEIVTRCLGIFIEYGPMLKKISFPRICLPVIVWGSALVNHGLLLLASFVIFILLGHFPGWAWLALPIGIVLISMLAFGLGLLLGVFNVFVRDIAQVFSVVLQIWFWLTPVVYASDAIPKSVASLVKLNPMTPLVRIYQEALLHDAWPSAMDLIWPAALSIALIAVATIVFRRASPELVDVL